jgi:RNA polymerase sigma-70 factor (ECF subfamily)
MIAGPPNRESSADEVGGVRVNKRAAREASIRRHVSAMVERESSNLLDHFARRVDAIEDTADLVGDTLLVVWRKASLIPRDDVEAGMWLYGVARKVLSTYRRGHHRRIALADRLRGEIITKATITGLGGQPKSESDDLQEHVRVCVRELAPIDREIIMLVHWEGFNLAEAARLLSMRPATLRSRYARIRGHLQARLHVTDELP